MAVTRIWPIKTGSLIKVIDYVSNTSKTDEKNFSDEQIGKMYSALHDVSDHVKTEKRLFVKGINCIPENAKNEMINTKKRFEKEGGILAYHAYQSFRPDEVTPELAHKIGVELAEKMWGDRFEIIVSTHMNAHCTHNHILLNSVSFIDGGKFNSCKRSYEEMRKISDELCRENDLSDIGNPVGRRIPYVEYKAKQNGEISKYDFVRQDLDYAVYLSFTQRQFLKIMKDLGYQFREGKKYMYIFHDSFPKGLRLCHLGEEYRYGSLMKRIYSENLKRERPFPDQDFIADHIDFPEVNDETIQAYICLIKIMSHVRSHPERNHALVKSFAEELIIFNKRVEQQNLMIDHDLYTDDDVNRFKKECEEELKEIDEARYYLRSDLRKALRSGDENKAIDIRSDISLLSQRMAKLRKQICICNQITESSPAVRAKVNEAKNIAEWQQKVRSKTDRER